MVSGVSVFSCRKVISLSLNCDQHHLDHVGTPLRACSSNRASANLARVPMGWHASNCAISPSVHAMEAAAAGLVFRDADGRVGVDHVDRQRHGSAGCAAS